MHFSGELRLHCVLKLDQIGAAYKRLEFTTHASSLHLLCFGPPVFGIIREDLISLSLIVRWMFSLHFRFVINNATVFWFANVKPTEVFRIISMAALVTMVIPHDYQSNITRKTNRLCTRHLSIINCSKSKIIWNKCKMFTEQKFEL